MINQQKIPKGWKELSFNQVITEIIDFRGKTPKKLGMDWGGGSIPALSANNVKKGYIDFNSECHLASEELYNKWMNKGDLREGDIIFTMEAPLGNVAIVPDDKKYLLSQRVVAFRPSSEVNNYYLFHYLLSDIFQNKLDLLSTGSTAKGINQKSLSKVKFLVPTCDQQVNIVQVLDVWDKYVKLLKQKISIKKGVEKSLKYSLLTGKNYLDSELVEKEKRFFKVPKHWGVVPISSIAKEVSIKNRDGSELPVLSCTKHNGLVDSLKFFKKQIFSKDLSTYKIVSRNEFAYATNHIEEGSIGLQKIYDQALVSPMYTVFKTNESILPEYLFPLLKTELYRCMFEAATSSSVNRRGSLRWKTFSKIKIPLPPIEEQQKIVSMLHVARQEIETLEKQYQLVTEQKNYLLNNLITGQIRVPEFASHN